MVDNSSVPVASGNETFANDDIGGVKYPRPKINWGPDGTANDVDVASGKPLPVQLRSATGLVPFGEPTDDKNNATDTTSVSAISLLKRLSAALQILESAALAEDAVAGSGDKGIMALAVRRDTVLASGADGDYVTLNIDANGRLYVQNVGNVAHDAADAGDPVKVGAKAAPGLSGATLVAAADRINLVGGLDGALFVRTQCGLEDIVSGTASNTDGTSTEVIATAGAGVKQYLTRVSLSNSHASTVVMVALKSGTTSKYRVLVPPSSGREIFFDPPLPPNAADEAWNFDPDAAVTTIECSMVGFKSKV